jgi:hypothetical protein
MSNGSINKRGRKKKDPIREKDVQGLKYIDKFLPLFERFHNVNAHHNRELYFEQYITLILLYFFNPVLTSLRSIQQASHLDNVKKAVGVKGAGLSTLSDAGNVFDANLIAPLISELAQKAIPLETDPKLKILQQQLVAVDGTLLNALPRMLWALWIDDKHRAAKLHLELDILKSAPVNAAITDGNANEKTVLRKFLSKDKIYVLDAGYSEYKLFQEIIDTGSSFVGRLRDNAVWETIEDRALSDDDKKAGVQRDIVVRLGCKGKQDDLTTNVRVIEVFHRGDSLRPRKSRVSSKGTFRTTETDYIFYIVTNLMDIPAEVIALIFRYRWQIELFFRWFKCVLGCKHLLSLSENGVSIQVYCALIASMLITLWTGCKPNKRTFEMLCLYFMGWANEEELAQHIKKLREAEEKKKTF